MKEYGTILKQNNLKVTPQRLAIFSLLDSSTSHPSAETIYNELIDANPFLSLATIYKNLDTLKSSGLIQELNVGEASYRYDSKLYPHPHSICLKCGEVNDLPHLESHKIATEELSIKMNFKIEKEQLYYYGTCEKCQEEE